MKILVTNDTKRKPLTSQEDLEKRITDIMQTVFDAWMELGDLKQQLCAHEFLEEYLNIAACIKCAYMCKHERKEDKLCMTCGLTV